MRFCRLIVTIAIGALAVGLPLLLARSNAWTTLRRVEWPAMGTVAGLTFRGGDASTQDAVRESVQQTYVRLNALLSAWDPDSELCRLARAGDTNAFAHASTEVRPCYQAALDLAAASGNAFNPRVGARLRELGFSHGQPFCDFDLGAIAKGFAVDAAVRALPSNLPFDGLLVDLGGNLRAVRGSWRTGVRNPFGDGLAAALVLADGESVATSGNYERFVERDGKRYSHILDGRTGDPVTGVAGVTVVTPPTLGATLADGLSTTLFVLGPTEGARFLREHAETYGAAQVLWIPDTPANPEILATPEMAARLADAAFPVRVVR
ncbi:MAG: FAD:protein FMN transferase [Kiritimatiellae bacterium]|nr:FAD:protein FMN transferase [Kiritimatiellia bacterium]